MIPEFKLSSSVNSRTLVMATSGYINNIGGQKILEEYTKHQDAVDFVILNLADSHIVNSIGISFVIEMIEKLGKKSGKLIFTNLDPTIDKTFTIMGLYHFAKKAATVDEAMALTV
ncbi:MAG: STAS domain-containing protein [Bacteroidetes bacterium]|nr:STAS domain-containing protein [Bacteroidota bacterium]